MTFLSLFAGIGGLDLGLERAGMRCIGQVEIDPFALAVLEKRFPKVPRFKDVRTFNAGMLKESPQLICGGFPCQDVSTAGTMRGLGFDTRTGLYREVLRLADEFRPDLLLMENVAGLFVDGRIGVVLGDLAAGGFDAEWDCIPACAVGAHHIRDRVFILAYAKCSRWAEIVRRGNTRILGAPANQASTQRATKTVKAPCGGEGVSIWPDSEESGSDDAHDRGGLPERPILAERWMDEPEMGRVADGIPRWLDRYRGLGNAVHPSVSEWIGRRILDAA